MYPNNVITFMYSWPVHVVICCAARSAAFFDAHLSEFYNSFTRSDPSQRYDDAWSVVIGDGYTAAVIPEEEFYYYNNNKAARTTLKHFSASLWWCGWNGMEMCYASKAGN